jgi:hypothetical protein
VAKFGLDHIGAEARRLWPGVDGPVAGAPRGLWPVLDDPGLVGVGPSRRRMRSAD